MSAWHVKRAFVFHPFKKTTDDLKRRRLVWIQREYMCVRVDFNAFIFISGVASGPFSVCCSIKSTLALTDPTGPEDLRYAVRDDLTPQHKPVPSCVLILWLTHSAVSWDLTYFLSIFFSHQNTDDTIVSGPSCFIALSSFFFFFVLAESRSVYYPSLLFCSVFPTATEPSVLNKTGKSNWLLCKSVKSIKYFW